MRASLVTTVALCACMLYCPARADQAQPVQEGSVKVTPVMKADRNIAGQPIQGDRVKKCVTMG